MTTTYIKFENGESMNLKMSMMELWTMPVNRQGFMTVNEYLIINLNRILYVKEMEV